MKTLMDLQSRNLPRLGFLGVGWIGRHRMEAIANAGLGHISAICDGCPETVQAVQHNVPDVTVLPDLNELLAADLDGIVIATPSALHAHQSIRALEAGLAVFSQKPIGRDGQEVAAVLAAAKRADRLFLADFSYRHTLAAQAIRKLLFDRSLGNIFAIDLTFHNAYGPDKAWFYDPALSGGGCLSDLGIHLADLALWMLDFPEVDQADGALYHEGHLLAPDPQICEDYAAATMTTVTGTSIRLACSWKLHAGQDAVIEATFYGTDGSATMINCSGSFYDFEAFYCQGTSRRVLASPPDDWGARAAMDFARRLAVDARFDPEALHYLDAARTIDRIYKRNETVRQKRSA